MNFAATIMILSFIKDKTCGLLTFVLYKMYCPKTNNMGIFERFKQTSSLTTKLQL